jgi:hypothetical protein
MLSSLPLLAPAGGLFGAPAAPAPAFGGGGGFGAPGKFTNLNLTDSTNTPAILLSS